MPEFLELLPPDAALAKFLDHLPPGLLGAETVPIERACGRTLAQDVIAPEPLPPFPRSTVDGFAVRAADTFGASDSLPAYLTVVGEVPMGRAAGLSLESGQTALIHTGGMLPAGADAVVMLEYTQSVRPGEVEVLRPAGVGENVLLTGEDVQSGDVVIPAGRILRPAEIGGLAGLGILQVPVARRPKIGILSSGDEVVPPAKPIQPGQVRDVNSYSLGALIERHGGQVERLGIVPDRPEVLEAAAREALEDLDGLVITAGSSASSRDLTAAVIDRLGEPGVLVHGVNVRPGKPTILGVCGEKPVVGLPGNPVSALVIAALFVLPAVRRLLGGTGHLWPVVVGQMSVNLPSQAGRVDYLPARVHSVNGGFQIEPIFFKSNLIFSLAAADGLLYIPADATGLSAGDIVQVYLLE